MLLCASLSGPVVSGPGLKRGLRSFKTTMAKAVFVFLVSIGLTDAFIPSAFSPAFRKDHFLRNKVVSHGPLTSYRSLNSLSQLSMKDFPKPNVEDTQNYREAERLSQKFKDINGAASPKTVAIIGGTNVCEEYEMETDDLCDLVLQVGYLDWLQLNILLMRAINRLFMKLVTSWAARSLPGRTKMATGLRPAFTFSLGRIPT